MREAIFTASSMSWLTKTTVFFSAACSFMNSSWITSRLIGSIAPKGSSIEQHRRIGRERAHDADALLLPARELLRVALEEDLGIEIDHRPGARRRAGATSRRSQPSRSGTTQMLSSTVMFGNSPICWIT